MLVTRGASAVNHDHIVDRDLIGQYRRGSLSAADTEAFEGHLLGCEDCQTLLAADARLERGMRAAAARSVAGSGAASPRAVAPTRRRPPLRLALAAAATLAGIIATPWIARPWLQVQPQAGLPLYRVAVTRGPAPETIELHVPPRVAWYALELEAPEPNGPCCRVVIEDADGATVWEGETQVAPDTGLVRVLLSRSFLRTGSYRIVLYATTAPAVRLIEHQVLVQLDH